MNIVLCGIKHCGKTTLGKLLAASRNALFVDTDELIETNYALTHGEALRCREMFRKLGRDEFHKLEAEALEHLAQSSDEFDAERVIALGGGVAANPLVDGELIKRLGLAVYLEVPCDAAWCRIAAAPELPAYLIGADRPQEEFMKLAGERAAFYSRSAGLTVRPDPEAKPEANLALLEEKLKEFI